VNIVFQDSAKSVKARYLIMTDLDLHAEIMLGTCTFRDTMEELWGQLWGNHWACKAPNVFEDFLSFTESSVLETGSRLPPRHWGDEAQRQLDSKLMDEFKEYFIKYVEYRATN